MVVIMFRLSTTLWFTPARFALGQIVITCYGFNATIVGSPGTDTIVGTPGRDIIVTLGGGDRVQALGMETTLSVMAMVITHSLAAMVMTTFMAALSLALIKEISIMVTEDQTLICASMLRM
jgi:hypothetical protein